MQDYKIIFYDTPNGKEPAKEFIRSLPAKLRAQTSESLFMLQEFGYEIMSRRKM